MSLRQKVISGIGWSFGARVGQYAIGFVITVTLARLLTPSDFGLVAMVTVFAAFAALFGDMGLGAAIIQRQDIEERHLSSTFWLNIGAGLFIAAIIAACSPLIAWFYGQPILIPLTILISLNFIISSVSIVQNALLSKNMEFRRLAAINIAAITVSGGISIAMALIGFGVWSLVANSLLTAAITAAIMWHLSDWRPKLVCDFQAIRELFGFSANLMGFRIVNYWASNIDNLLIGKYVSSAALGVYSRAFELMLLPVNQLSWMLSRVMFPALSVIQDDKEKIKEIFLRANRAIALLSFPMMSGLLVVAKPFILAIYGEKWEEVIPILQIFCFLGLPRSVGTTLGWIYLSQGRTDLQFIWGGLFSGLVRIAAIIIGLRWGAIGVAVALVLSRYLIIWYPAWAIAGRLINLTFAEMVKNLDSTFYCSAAMATGVFAAGFVLPMEWAHWVRLLVQVVFGIALYGVLIHLFRIRAYCELRELAAEQWRLRYGKPAEA